MGRWNWISKGDAPRVASSAHACAERLEDRIIMSVALGNGFGGLTAQDSGIDNGSVNTPPDGSIAAGKTKLIEIVNSSAKLTDKNGSKVDEQTLGSFFGAPASAFISDPSVKYDEISKRFIAVATNIDFTGQGQSNLLIATSKSSNPSDLSAANWNTYSANVTESLTNGDHTLADFPQLGIDADGIYVTFNMFDLSGPFAHASIIAIKKSTALSGGPLSFNDTQLTFNDQGLQPALVHDGVHNAPEWFVEETGDGTHANLIKMTNKLTAKPSLSYKVVTVPGYAAGASTPASNPGNLFGTPIQTNGTNFFSAAIRGNHLVAAQNVGDLKTGPPDMHARWYEFNISSNPVPHLDLVGEIRPANGAFTYYPSIDIAPNGDLGMTYIESGGTNNEHMSVYVTGRKASDPNGTMHVPKKVASADGLEDFTFGSAGALRAGDFSGTAVDPVDGSFWSENEYASIARNRLVFNLANTNWATWVQNYAVLAAGAAQPIGPGKPLAMVLGTGRVGQPILTVPIQKKLPKT